jgi:hypothetical protein
MSYREGLTIPCEDSAPFAGVPLLSGASLQADSAKRLCLFLSLNRVTPTHVPNSSILRPPIFHRNLATKNTRNTKRRRTRGLFCVLCVLCGQVSRWNNHAWLRVPGKSVIRWWGRWRRGRARHRVRVGLRTEVHHYFVLMVIDGEN